MNDTIETRVTRGAALLDEKMPGWHERVDLDRLDIESCSGCVLGQLGEESIENSAFEAAAIDLVGFDAFNYDTNAPVLIGLGLSDRRGIGMKRFEELTAEWKRVILARRGGA